MSIFLEKTRYIIFRDLVLAFNLWNIKSETKQNKTNTMHLDLSYSSTRHQTSNMLDTGIFFWRSLIRQLKKKVSYSYKNVQNLMEKEECKH